MAVTIRETPIGGDLRDFLEVVDDIYADDPKYVRPLDMDLKQRLSPKNPFFEHGEGTVFTAYRDGKCVGRCTAQIDRLHLERYNDQTGFFGFLDTVDDPSVANELLEAARNWLAKRGMKRIRGPISLSVNEELGCLVEGFDTPPMIMMPHHRPYQSALIEKAGLTKIKDMFAWRYDVGDIPPRARKAHDEIAKLPEIKSRTIDKSNVERDVRVVMDIYNDAWNQNWGYVPLTEGELKKMAEDLKMILVPELTVITEIDGEAAAIALALPNVNEVIQDFGGKLFPLGLPKLLWRLKVKNPRTARLIILGIRKKYRQQRKYAALSIYLYTRMHDAGKKLGYTGGELSWTLEDNGPVNAGIQFMGGKLYKRYRLFEREI